MTVYLASLLQLCDFYRNVADVMGNVKFMSKVSAYYALMITIAPYLVRTDLAADTIGTIAMEYRRARAQYEHECFIIEANASSPDSE